MQEKFECSTKQRETEQKYHKLKKLSQTYLDQQKAEFEKCVTKYEKELESYQYLQEAYNLKLDEFEKLEQEMLDLQDRVFENYEQAEQTID